MKSVTGYEAEGRLCGVQTLFVHDVLPIDCERYPHVYFNPSYIRSHGYQNVVNLLGKTLVTVCLELNQLSDIPAIVLQLAHVVLSIPCPVDFRCILKPQDEIRLDYKPFENSTVQVACFHHATLTDYLNDKEI